MSQRFYVTSPISSSTHQATVARLTDSEAHHLIHVMRASAGDVVTLFDGTGAEYEASVIRVGRSDVELRIERRVEVARESPARVNLGIALPKGDRQRWFIEKACELGVERCVPLMTRRGVAQPESGTLDKLRRAAIEAAKQCGRNRLPDLTAPLRWPEFLDLPTASATKWIAHPPILAASRQLESAPADLPQEDSPRADSSHGVDAFAASVRESLAGGDVWLAVGPEGGFSEDEVRAALERGWRPIGLGPRILRVETAALALLAAVSAFVEWSDLR